MILVDSPVWIDHLRSPDERLSALLSIREILVHPFVLGELFLGMIRNRSGLIETFRDLPQASVAGPHEVLALIASFRLYGRGIGYVDTHLLASTLMMPGTLLWSRDRRLAAVAGELGVAASVP